MKKCDYYKDLILTDYIDGQLDKITAESIESHLLDCSDCRLFFKEVKNNTALPFNQVSAQPIPTELWDTIRQNIENENQSPGPLWGFLDKLKGLLVLPRLVPVFASLVLMILVGSVTFNTMQIKQAQAKDQGEYLVSLLSPADSSTATDSNDTGSAIEHYFL